MDLTRISDNCASTEEFAEDLAKVLQLVEVSATCDDDTELVPLLICKSEDDYRQVYEDLRQNGCKAVAVKYAKENKIAKGMLCSPYAVIPANDGNLDLGHIENPEFCLKVIDARDERFLIGMISDRFKKDNAMTRDVYQTREIGLAKRIKNLH